ncbi:MAG: DUF4062 domain-containing protein [Clostridiales bacterium]|nr:DUF4062 domain-containing protein [Clostridiales bacterium]
MAGNVKQHVPVFVSSTYADLEAHRAEVQRRLVGLEQIVKGMEYFGSSPDEPLETCLKNISDCKLFILLVGASYGSVYPGLGKSFTELEYEYAIKMGIPVLVYMADMNSTTVGIPLAGVDTKHVADLNSFKEKLKKLHTVSTFTSIDDLGKKVEHDVPEMLRQLNGNIRITVKKTELSETVNEDMLREGAVMFEKFWLRPSRYAGETVPLRLQINKKWGGWKVKDELVEGVGLEVGDTINTEVIVDLTKGIINGGDDTDLFAGGDGADWLLDNEVIPGDTIECYVRFANCRAPIGQNGKIINTVALVFVKGIRVIRE